LIDKLQKDERICQNKTAMQGLEEMKLLLRYCELYGILDQVAYDLNIVVLFPRIIYIDLCKIGLKY